MWVYFLNDERIETLIQNSSKIEMALSLRVKGMICIPRSSETVFLRGTTLETKVCIVYVKLICFCVGQSLP